jgi:hypothetical protein
VAAAGVAAAIVVAVAGVIGVANAAVGVDLMSTICSA